MLTVMLFIVTHTKQHQSLLTNRDSMDSTLQS